MFTPINKNKTATITGTGMAVPDCVVDNELLVQCMTTSNEWIVERTGIKERRVSPDTYEMLQGLAEAPDKTEFMDQVYAEGLDGELDSSLSVSDLAYEASTLALDNAGLEVDQIDCIVESTTIPDFAYPHTGCVLQEMFEMGSTPAINLQQGCAGFVYCLAIADHFIRTGLFDRILVVGAELLTCMFDYSDRGRDMAVLFGDGAGAVVVEPAENSSSKILSHQLHTDGSKLDALSGEIYGSSTYPVVSKQKIEDGRARPRMDGRQVFVEAVKSLKEVVREVLEANQLTTSDVDHFLFHQANKRILDSAADGLDIRPEKVYVNVDKYGNTAAASVPICLHEAVSSNRIEEGDLVLLAAFGTGFSWGASLLTW